MESYMSDKDRILSDAGVYHRCGHVKKPPADDNLCKICYDEADSGNMLAMPCGHAFCRDCWSDFCISAVSDGPVCVQKTCPQFKCTEVVTEEEMKNALRESSPTFKKYLSFQLRSFVDSSPLARCCPGAGCERVACASSAAALEAVGGIADCDECRTSFCLVCGEEPHAPTTCKGLERWNEKCRDESESANWILANTKSCPNCNTRIEKNQGCNHMTCRQCRHEFCWICMGKWCGHSGCNK